jgi:hypothetical protein
MITRRIVLLDVTFGMIVIVSLGVCFRAVRMHCNQVVS